MLRRAHEIVALSLLFGAVTIVSNVYTATEVKKIVEGQMPSLPGGARIPGSQLEIGNTIGANSSVYGVLVPRGHTWGFPTALSDYVNMSNPGDQGFAHYSAAYGTTNGLWTSEFSSFNYSADGPSNYPWSRSFGIKDSLGIPVTCSMHGPFLSAACIEIGYNPDGTNRGGQYGVAVQAGSVAQAALIVDATADKGARADLVLRHRASADRAAIELETVGVGDAPVMRHVDRSGLVTFQLDRDGSFVRALVTKDRFNAPLHSPSKEPCSPGDWVADTQAIYICTSQDHWKHANLID